MYTPAKSLIKMPLYVDDSEWEWKKGFRSFPLLKWKLKSSEIKIGFFQLCEISSEGRSDVVSDNWCLRLEIRENGFYTGLLNERWRCTLEDWRGGSSSELICDRKSLQQKNWWKRDCKWFSVIRMMLQFGQMVE